MSLYSNSAPQLATALVRATPLILSSSSLMFCWVQEVFFRAFLHPTLRAKDTKTLSPSGGAVLPRYMAALYKPALKGILLTYPPTTVLLVVDGVWSGQSREVRWMYLAGAILSAGHFMWAPGMTRSLKRISEGGYTSARNEDEMEHWLRQHFWRTVLVNMPAYVCILLATLGTFVEGLK